MPYNIWLFHVLLMHIETQLKCSLLMSVKLSGGGPIHAHVPIHAWP